jgi:hypothetical protein
MDNRKNKGIHTYLNDVGFLSNLGIIMFSVMQILDFLETYYAVNINGNFIELNLIMAVFVGGGFLSLFFVKLSCVILGGWFFYLIRRWYGCNIALVFIWLLTGLFTAVVVMNVFQLVGLTAG